MPETTAAWIAANTLTATSVLTYSQIVALTYAAYTAASLAYGNHQRRKQQRAARDAFNASLQDRLVMTATAQAARSRVYGRVRNVDGVVFKQTHGTNKEFYTLVIALAGHEVDAIEQVWFNDAPVTLDGSGNVTSAPWAVTGRSSPHVTMTVAGGAGSVVLPSAVVSGTVVAVIEHPLAGSPEITTSTTVTGTLSGSTFSVTGAPLDGEYRVTWNSDATESRARVRMYTGAPGQNLYADLTALVGGAVGASDRFEGFAALLVTLQYDQDAFPSGVPSISAVMRGARVYDPRTATTAWTQNPALIARDWSLYAYGGGCSSAELNEPSFTAAANACDVSTAFALPAGGPVVLPLYQCGIVIPLDANPDEALSEVCEAMAGQWGWGGGKLSVRAGVYRAPVATITEDWLSGAEAIRVTPGAGQAEAINIIRPTYADAAQGYVQTPGPEVRATSYVTADGRELVSELQLGGVTQSVHAQHVCGVLLREAREGLTVQLPCNLRAYPLELFDVVSVTLSRFGWAAKLFEVVGWSFSITGGVMLTLRETAAAIYTPDAEFDLLNTSPNTGLPRPAAPPALTGLAATSGGVAQLDGSSLARIRVTWDAVASEAVRQSGSIEVQVAEVYPGLPTGDWPTLAPVAGRALGADVFGQRIGRLVAIRARAVNTLGMRGPWRQITHLVSGKRAPIVWRQAAAPSGAAVQDGDEWVDTDDGNRRYLRVAGAWVDVRDVAANTAIVYLFRRASSTPAVPSGTLTYTFATNALSGTLDGWSTTVPAGTDPLYVTVATATSANATDTIASGEWAAPVVMAQNGAPGSTGATGAAGSNAATVYLFQRTATTTPPSLPSASVTYTFATGAATGVNNGWTQSMPTSGGSYRWITTATALGTGASDTIAAGEWAAASLLAEDGVDGVDGDDGVSVYVGTIYSTSASAPGAPTGGSFNFGTGVLTPPSGWQLAVPGSSAAGSWVTTFTFVGATPTSTVTAGTWATPVAAPRAVPVNFVKQFGYFAASYTGTSGSGEAAAVRFVTDGTAQQNTNSPPSTWTNIGSWFSGTVDATYYIRFTTNTVSGGALTGSDSGWLALSSNRIVELLRSTVGVATAIVDYQIAADSAGATVLAIGTIELTAEYAV